MRSTLAKNNIGLPEWTVARHFASASANECAICEHDFIPVARCVSRHRFYKGIHGRHFLHSLTEHQKLLSAFELDCRHEISPFLILRGENLVPHFTHHVCNKSAGFQAFSNRVRGHVKTLQKQPIRAPQVCPIVRAGPRYSQPRHSLGDQVPPACNVPTARDNRTTGGLDKTAHHEICTDIPSVNRLT